MHMLNKGHCNPPTITDAAFVHLKGIHMLAMAFCNQPTITDAAFVHLKGMYMLNMGWCDQPTVTDGASFHLVAITFPPLLTGCNQFTSEGLAKHRYERRELF
jgi:hypothetical protein